MDNGLDKLVAEYLAKGGKITMCPENARTLPQPYSLDASRTKYDKDEEWYDENGRHILFWPEAEPPAEIDGFQIEDIR